MSGFMPFLWCKWLMVTYQSYLEMFGSSRNKCRRTLFIRARIASSVRQQQPSRRGCLEHQWSTWLFDSTTQQSSQHTTKTVINLIVWQHHPSDNFYQNGSRLCGYQIFSTADLWQPLWWKALSLWVNLDIDCHRRDVKHRKNWQPMST